MAEGKDEQLAFFTRKKDVSEPIGSNGSAADDARKNSSKSEAAAASLEYDVSKVSHPKSDSASVTDSISEHLPDVQSVESIDSSKSPKPFIPSLNLKSLSQSETKSSVTSDSFENKSGSKISSANEQSPISKSNKSTGDRISNESSIHIPMDWTDESGSLGTASKGDVNKLSLENKSVDSEKSKSSEGTNKLSESKDDPGGEESDPIVSNSEDIIQLDIRGTASANRPIQFISKIILSPFNTLTVPFQQENLTENYDQRDMIASPPLEDDVSFSEPLNHSGLDSAENFHVQLLNRGLDPGHEPKPGNIIYEQDCDVEEMILNESRDVFPSKNKSENVFSTGKSAGEQDLSLSTVATDYRTLCEDYHHKMTEFQCAIDMKNEQIEELQSSIEQLKYENNHLSQDVVSMQNLISNSAHVDGETKGQLSDFAKNENFIKEDIFPITLRQFKERQQQENLVKLTNSTQTEDINDVKSEFEKMLPISNDYIELSEQFLENIADLFSSCEMNNDAKYNIIEKMKNEVNDIVKLHLKEFYNHTTKIISDKNIYEAENRRLKNVVKSMKSDNPDIEKLKNELENIHYAEMKNLTTYYEKKCVEIGKTYSEEIYSQHSKKSPNSSLDSLNNCPEALPFGSPMHTAKLTTDNGENSSGLKHSISAEYLTGSTKLEKQLQEMAESHAKFIRELTDKHNEEVSELKAHLQTLENTVKDNRNMSFGNSDADLELEKNITPEHIKHDDGLDVNHKIQTENKQALLSGADLDLTNPLSLINLRNRIQVESQQEIEQFKMAHAEELSSLRNENSRLLQLTEKHKVEEEKRKKKRNEIFDKNRRLEEVVKERDGLKHMIQTLRNVLSQLVEYFNLCEDELNNTFVGELIKQVVAAHENYDHQLILRFSDDSDQVEDFNETFLTNFNTSDANSSALSDSSKKSNRMHFAPNLEGIMSFIESESILECMNQSQDISVNFKNDLDFCLKRLRQQAHELLLLSTRTAQPKRLSILSSEDQLPDGEPSNVQDVKIKDTDASDYNKIRKELDQLKILFEKNEAIRKELEASLAESMSHEVILKQQLEDAMSKIAEIMPISQLDQTQEIVSEGYGIVTHPKTPVSLPPHPRFAITSPPPFLIGEQTNASEGAQCLSLDGAMDKRLPKIEEYVRQLISDIENATKEKEDLQSQLESANKQLRSTRQFLDGQASEREQERDEFQKELIALREENSKLLLKTQNQSKICKESQPEPLQELVSSHNVEQLENQIQEMSSMINEFQNQKQDSSVEINTLSEKNKMLNDIIVTLESRLEQKSVKENEVLEELNSFKEICSEREKKIQDLVKELEIMKGKVDQMINDEALAESQAKLNDSFMENDRQVVEQMEAEIQVLRQTIAERTTALENLHEAVCSQSCSSPSEDVSVRDHKKRIYYPENNSFNTSKLLLQLPIIEISQLSDSLHKHFRAEDAALKRIKDLEMQLKQLKDVAEEIRTERDLLHQRFSEQSLKISSLQSRLDQTRHTAEAMRHQSTEDLRLKLDQAEDQVRRLTEALDSRDKQVERLKSVVNSTKKKLIDQEKELSACSSKETIQRLKAELAEQQAKIRELQELADASNLQKDLLPLPLESLVADKNADIELLKQQLLEKEQHLQAILSLKLEEDQMRIMSPNDKDDGKLSARTLSDVLSISEFDEPEVMRKAELKPHSFMSGTIVGKDLTHSHLSENQGASPRLTQHIVKEFSPILENEETHNRNINETTVFGSNLPATGDSFIPSNLISDNCSMFPNKDATSERNATIEPKKIDFSTSGQNSKSLKELDIDIDERQKVYPDILTQLKTEIMKLQHELKLKASLLKKAEEQLTEFPALQNDMYELKSVFQNTLKAMDESKNYYEGQLDRFTNVEELLKQKLEMALHDVGEKSKELHLLKEDIVRRENVILELAKEKRSLEVKLNDINFKKDIKDSPGERQELEQIIKEKNLQIDNLNYNLDHLDDLKRTLQEKEENLTKIQALLEDYQKENTSIKTQNAELTSELKKIKETKNIVEIENKKYLDVISQLEKELENITNKDKTLQSNIEELEELQKLEEFKNLLSELDTPRMIDGKEKSIKLDNQKLTNIRNKVANLKSIIEVKQNELLLKTEELHKVKDEAVKMIEENKKLNEQLQEVQNRLREEGNLDDIRMKLSKKVQECSDLEREISSIRETFRSSQMGPEEYTEMLHENERLKQQLEICESRIVDQENIILELNGMKESLISDLQTLEHNTVVEKDTSARLQFLLDNEKQMASNIQCHDSSVIQILRGRLEVALDSESELKVLLEREKLESEQLHKQIDMLTKQIELLENTNGNGSDNNVSDAALQEKLKNVSAQLEDQIEISELLKSETMLLKTKYDREKGRLIDLQNVLDREKLWFQKEIAAREEQCNTYKGELTELQKLKHEMHLELVHSRETLHLQNNEIMNLEKRVAVLQGSQKDIQRSDSKRAIIDDLEQQKSVLNSEVSKLKHSLQCALEREKHLRSLASDNEGKMGSKIMSEVDLSTLDNLKEMPVLLKRHISENIHLAETIKDLTHERRELQARVKYLENQLKMGVKHSSSEIHLPEGIDQQVRFLYGRYIRTESYRKALLWQKKYLMRVSMALDEWRMNMGISIYPPRSKGAQRFKCVGMIIVAIVRMKYLVRRWHTETRLAANIHLNIPNVYPSGIRSSKSYSHVPTVSKDKGESRHSLTNPMGSFTPVAKNANKSWSYGSGIPQSQGHQSHRPGKLYINRPSASAMSLHQPEFVLSPEPRHKGFSSHRNIDQLFAGHESPRLREIPSDLVEHHIEERLPLRSSSEHDISPMLSKYASRIDQINMKLHRALHIPKDPP